MYFSFSFQNTTIVPFKYRKKTKNIPIEEYRRKNIRLESEVVIQWPSYSCNENLISYTQYKN